MDIYAQIIDKIIKRHEKILGPMAYRVASTVQGLTIEPQNRVVTLQENKKEVLEKLLAQYEKILGKMAIIHAKEAVKDLIPQVPADQIPQALL